MASEDLHLLENLVAATNKETPLTLDMEKVVFEATMRVLEAPQPPAKMHRLAVQLLTNLTDNEARCGMLLADYPQLGALLAAELKRRSSVEAARDILDLMTNLTRQASWAEAIVDLPSEKFNFLEAVCRSTNGWFEAVLPLVLNLAQTSAVRRELCRPDTAWMAAVVSFIAPDSALATRRLAAGIMKNVAFEDDCHPHLVGDGSDFLPAILRALGSSSADPEFEIDAEDLEELPDSVQDAFRDAKHEREMDEEVRLCLLKTLLQLCSTPVGREAQLDANAYVVLRELYKWEGERGSREALVAARHVIDVLITEAEPKKEEVVPDYDASARFRTVEVPEEQVELVERLDKELLTG